MRTYLDQPLTFLRLTPVESLESWTSPEVAPDNDVSFEPVNNLIFLRLTPEDENCAETMV
ncbi:hypothetical protein K7432_015918 [Basidiobolus ranarum]|uniref:Uncharacterized protein n=1 Tax=Basidiobolus ranarum TaxID=34480 RepID=A0ABR2VMD0_9FUNG